MSITDELRDYVRHYSVAGSSKDKTLTAIADRIDAAHRSALEKLAAQVDESEDGWVRLPVDADGVPIRIGDVMEFGEIGPIQHLELWDDGDWVVVVEYEHGHFTRWHPSACRHHHAPTVEDVLREFADRVCNSGHQWRLDAADTIAEFAAKLRLAGEGE